MGEENNNSTALIPYVQQKRGILETISSFVDTFLDGVGYYYDKYGRSIKTGLDYVEYTTTKDGISANVIDKERYIQRKINRTLSEKAEYISSVILSSKDHYILRHGENRHDFDYYCVKGIDQSDIENIYGRVKIISMSIDGVEERDKINDSVNKHMYEIKFEKEKNNNKNFNRSVDLSEYMDYHNKFTDEKSVLNYRYYCRFTNTIIYNDLNAMKHDLDNYSYEEIFEQVREGLNGLNLKEEFFNLSDRDLFVIRNKRIVILKKASYEERQKVLKTMRNDIDPKSNIVIFKNTKDKTIMGGNIHKDYVEFNDNDLRKNKLYFNEGIIYTTLFSPEGNLFFQTKKEAEAFLDKYGNIAKFISSKEWNNIKDNILPEEERKRFRQGVLATVSTLTVTVGGIIAAALIDSLNKKKEEEEVIIEVVKNSNKILNTSRKLFSLTRMFNFI